MYDTIYYVHALVDYFASLYSWTSLHLFYFFNSKCMLVFFLCLRRDYLTLGYAILTLRKFHPSFFHLSWIAFLPPPSYRLNNFVVLYSCSASAFNMTQVIRIDRRFGLACMYCILLLSALITYYSIKTSNQVFKFWASNMPFLQKYTHYSAKNVFICLLLISCTIYVSSN